MSAAKKPSRPTLQDVANHAGVSIASISRVLNNVPPISDELRATVEAAIRALGYTMRRSSTPYQPWVVAMVGDLHNTYFSEVLAGIQDQAHRNGYLVHILVNEHNAEFSERFCRWIMANQPQGLILGSSTGIPEEALTRIRDFSNLPVVSINRTFKLARIPSIRIDYERAIAKAVRHVANLGHKRIAFLNGSEGSYSSTMKRLGVGTALAGLGLVLEPTLDMTRPATIEGGFEAMNVLFELSPDRRPTAVVASTDLMALGAMHAIRSRGLSIPADITVVGFDDIAMAAHANPPLTSIAPPKFEMGVRAVDLVIARLGEGSNGGDDYVVMESPLIVRESSGPVPM